MATNMTKPCFPYMEAVSNGALQGDNPTKFALALLIIQTVVVLLVTRTMAMLFKPFRQPRVLAEIIGGVLLGPSGLGRNKTYLHTLFPKSSMTLLDTIATIGLLFFLFMVGLELDLKEIRRSGKTALIVAFSGITVPFLGGIGVATLLKESLNLETELAPLVVFLGVPVAITAFPVLVRIMAERRVLGTKLGRMVIPAAAINDVCAWILLAIGVAIAGPSKSPVTPAYVLICGIGYVIFMLTIVKRMMDWIAQRVNGQVTVSEIYVCITLVGVLLSAFATEVIGIHPLFGAFVFGLIVPTEGSFAKMLIDKVEDFITVLMLPLFFASSGLKTNLGSINSAKGVGFLVLLVLTAGVGKIGASAIVGRFLNLNLREAFAFGFLMNTKGLVELIVLNIGLDLGVFDDQTFAILVLMCLILMFFTTPAVMALYKPARNPVPYVHRKLEGNHKKKDELRILACVDGTRSIPGLLNLVESCRVTSNKRPVKLFPLHLIELTERTLSIINLSRNASQDGKTCMSPGDDGILVAFQAYGRISKVSVELLSVVSQLADMHYDVCNVAAEKRATVIILPYSVYQKEDGTIEYINNPGFKAVNQRVMQNAPCSVCVLVDRGPWSSTQLSDTTASHKVAVIFFGGPDDREALAFGCRLAEHPCVKVWVLRFKQKEGQNQHNHVIDIEDVGDIETENKRNEESLAAVKPVAEGAEKDPWQSIYYEEHEYVEDPTEAVVSIVSTSEFLLVMAGRQSTRVQNRDNSELGVVGDALANAGGEMKASILVIQQHNSSFTALNATSPPSN
ncbi:hypothetical protein GOP47_0013627 [Adiantum capillus-veneris]|uniref:Cation/H+ exchanger domain-containing protein n=1 Tax=Adiantum capillus-veneris TaxID=13818 RepID=A0A9D4UP32_ADICA|nr:hypothetical protein GOP47_0013627 [Adiantum capillus-veneris]